MSFNMFGLQKPAFGTSTFGTTPTFGSTFGQTTQAGASSLFGAKPSVSFGTTATAPAGGLFGTPPSTFGVATTGSSLFGGTSTFSTPTAGTLFGTSTQAKPTLFGATTASPFGASTTGAATGLAFGGAPGGSLFGAQQAASGGLFGAATQPTASTGGLFGSTAPGTTVKFNPKIDTDTMMKNTLQQTIQTKHQCVAAMKEYESKSLEELRAEDYLANRKGGSSAAQGGFTFSSGLGQPQQSAGLFGAASTAGSLFTQQKPLFGGSTAFGTATSSAPGASLFGQPAPQQSAGLFGAATTKPLFGAATTTSSFTFTTPSSTGGMFGQQQAQPTLFGAASTQPGMFGAPVQPQAAAPMFGAQSAAPTFAQQSLFGAGAAAAPTQGAFGAFGQQTFGQGAGLFGAKPATTTAPSFGGFGAGTFGGFGTTTQPTLFGAAQQQKPLFGGFGTQQPAFGAGAGAATGTGLFGASPFAGGQTLFGGQQQAKPGLNFGTGAGFGAAGLNFGGTGAPGLIDQQAAGIGTDYNTALLQQEVLKSQLFGLSTSPYGDRKLVKGSKSEEEPLPVPTDPLAQKRMLESVRTSSTLAGGIPVARPLPPFKPITRLTLTSPQITQPDSTTALRGIDSDTISFAEGFVPKKSIKKLVIKPKNADGSRRVGSTDSNANAPSNRNTGFPENLALTTAAHVNDVDRTTVKALKFDNTADQTELDDRSALGVTASSTRRESGSGDQDDDRVGQRTEVDTGEEEGAERIDLGLKEVVVVDLVASPDETVPAERPSPAGLGGETRAGFVDELMEEVEYEREPGKSLFGAIGPGTELPRKACSPSGALFAQLLREVQQSGATPLDRDSSQLFDTSMDYSVELGAQRTKRRTMLVDPREERRLEDSSMVELSQHRSELAQSRQSSLAAPRPEALFVTRPRRAIRQLPYDRSIALNKSAYWLDASLFNARRFRAGWAPSGKMVVKSDRQDDAAGIQLGRLLDGGAIHLPEEFSMSVLNVAQTEHPLLPDLDALLQCQFAFSDRCIEHGFNQFIPNTDGDATVDAYLDSIDNLTDRDPAASIFQLSKALWGTLEYESREESLSQWLIEQCRNEVDKTVDSLKRKGPDHYIEAVFCLLTSRRVEEAGRLAQEAGDWRLSLAISQMADSSQETRRLWSEQLKRWADVQADKYIDTTRLKIFALAAGLLKWRTSDGRYINVYENLRNWKLTFGLYLWYGCTPFVSIPHALRQYDADRLAPNGPVQPVSAHVTTDGDERAQFDVRYHLIRLFVDRAYSIFKVLDPSGWTDDPMDFHISWHLWCVLDAFGLAIADRDRLDSLHVQYAFQLERRGVWQRGIFVALHVGNAVRREALVKQILFQHASSCAEDEKAVLVNECGIPEEWIVDCCK